MNQVHIAGVGDHSLAGVTGLADPCPLPSAAKKKGLRDRDKLFYAPMSGLGDLLYDKDAVYININDHLVQFSNVDDENGGAARKGFIIVFAFAHICYIDKRSLRLLLAYINSLFPCVILSTIHSSFYWNRASTFFFFGWILTVLL